MSVPASTDQVMDGALCTQGTPREGVQPTATTSPAVGEASQPDPPLLRPLLHDVAAAVAAATSEPGTPRSRAPTPTATPSTVSFESMDAQPQTTQGAHRDLDSAPASAATLGFSRIPKSKFYDS